ncbi:hypothetical protein JCM8097_004360 [Rhodosporidiobolus ruineniae]
MEASPSEFELSQFTQTQPNTQPNTQPTQHNGWPDHLFGILVPSGSSSSTSLPPSNGRAPVSEPASLSTGSSGAPARRFELTRDQTTYTVGRHPKCDLVLNGPKISSYHAKITCGQDGVVRLADTSTNGTFVRGSKVGKGNVTILESGDSIVFGPATGTLTNEFRYLFQGPPVSSASADPYGLGELSQGSSSGIFADYEVREQLGKGSFAVVRKGVRRSDGKMVAVKIIQKARFSNNPQTLNMFQREIKIAKQLDHPFCVKCFDFYEDDQRIWLVLEYVDGGDLLDFVMKRGGLEEAQVREIALMTCQAVAYLHSKGITHRDLKPENLLLTKGAKPQIRVTDFGLAKMVNEGTMLKTMCGTPTYLAPEVIINNQPGIGYNSIVDAYSCGVIFYSCLTNQIPFDESESEPLHERMAHRSVDLNIPRGMGVSERALDFLDRLLKNDPRERLSCQDALSHPWLVTRDRTSPDSLPFTLGGSLPFNSGTAGGDAGAGGDMLPPVRNNGNLRPPPEPEAEGVEGGDGDAMQSAASLTSPAMSRVRGDDSMVDSQGFGNLRIAPSDASMTTPATSHSVEHLAPSLPVPLPSARPALAPLPISTERLSSSTSSSRRPHADADADMDYYSPQVAGQKRKVVSAFSDSSLSELPSQPSQDPPRPPYDEEVEKAAVMEVDFAEKPAKREKEEEDAEEEEREPSTVEEADEAPSPRSSRRTSRGGRKPATPARRSGRARGRASATPRAADEDGQEEGAGSEASGSASPEVRALSAEGGIAASVKNRRRKAARYT